VSTTETTAPMTPGPAGVPRWQPQFVTVRASRWFKNGDHPQDDCRMIKPDPASTTQFGPFLSEGQVVRRYRSPDDDGQRCCGDCRSLMTDHGWIDQGIDGRVVCPGDWVVSLPLTTPGLVAHFPVKPDVFDYTWQPYGPLSVLPPDHWEQRAKAAEAALAAVAKALPAAPEPQAGVTS
jgi:hypothetical protein